MTQTSEFSMTSYGMKAAACLLRALGPHNQQGGIYG